MNPAQLDREDPAHLVRLVKQAKRSTCRTSGNLLLIACELVHLTSNGKVAPPRLHPDSELLADSG
jgi:hypothetical protein